MKLWTFERQIVAGFIAVGLALAAAFTISVRNSEQLTAASRWVTHTQEVLGELEILQASLIDTETGVRGYLITGREPSLEPYYASRALVGDQLRKLTALTADNPEQQKRLSILNGEISAQLAYRDGLVVTAKSLGFDTGRKIVLDGAGKESMDKIRKIIGTMRIEENHLLHVRQAVSEQRDRNAGLVLNFLRIFMVSVLVGAYLITLREMRLRRKAEQKLQALNNELEDRVQKRTADLEAASHALRESEARLQTTLETLSEGVAVANMEGHLLHFNRAALALHEFANVEESKLNLPEFTQLVKLSTLEGKIIPLEQWPLSRVLKGETLRNLEISLDHLKAGWTRIYSYNGSLACDSEGKPILAVVTITDITKRKKSELKIARQLEHLNLLDQITRLIGERLDLKSISQIVVRTLEESLAVDFGCILRYDAATNTLTPTCMGGDNPALFSVLGLGDGATISVDNNGLGRCMRGELVCEQDISQAQFPFTQLLTRGGLRAIVMAPLRVESQIFGILTIARRKADSFTSSECEFLRQLSEHVALAAWHAQIHSALTQAYDDLRQTQQVILQEERLRALGQMASGIAHDINNALSPVSLYAESLLDNEKNLSPRARSYLETIHRAVDDVAQTVARMREFYRQREIQIELAPVDINRLVGQVIELTRPRWQDMPQKNGIMIQAQMLLQSDLPFIRGVEGEIRDALINLIFNAADAMQDGGILTIQTRLSDVEKTPGEEDMLIVEVTDTGVGMDETTRQRCLEPFFTTKGERGTGLGLAMVFGMVRRHGADLKIESSLGKGTTMRLLFAVPVTGVPDDSTVSSHPAYLPRMHILLIDDDPILLKSLTDTLETDGHVVVAANGGEQGISMFETHSRKGKPFTLVITDLGMPYVDGHRVAGAIKRLSPQTPIILLTGWGQRLIAEREVHPNIDRVLSKPPKLKEIRDAFAALCAKQIDK